MSSWNGKRTPATPHRIGRKRQNSIRTREMNRGRPPALTETQAREAARLAWNGTTPMDLAERFNVSERTIARYVRRERDRRRGLSLDELLEQLAAERR